MLQPSGISIPDKRKEVLTINPY